MGEFGYAGEILKIDLSLGKMIRLPTANYAARFVGGRGLAAKLYWDMVPPEAKALGPENLISFVTGPAAGFYGVAGARWQVCGKSPQSDPEAFTYGNLGGNWGNGLKYAGFDALAVQGKAEKPVYLYIHNGQVGIKDANHLWGKSAFDTIDILKNELGQDVTVLTTGPAGEKMVVFATIFGEGGASGSSGLGSVMGSKKLKAIAVSGNRAPVAANPSRLQELVDRIQAKRAGMMSGGGGANRPSPGQCPASPALSPVPDAM